MNTSLRQSAFGILADDGGIGRLDDGRQERLRFLHPFARANIAEDENRGRSQRAGLNHLVKLLDPTNGSVCWRRVKRVESRGQDIPRLGSAGAIVEAPSLLIAESLHRPH